MQGQIQHEESSVVECGKVFQHMAKKVKCRFASAGITDGGDVLLQQHCLLNLEGSYLKVDKLVPDIRTCMHHAHDWSPYRSDVLNPNRPTSLTRKAKCNKLCYSMFSWWILFSGLTQCLSRYVASHASVSCHLLPSACSLLPIQRSLPELMFPLTR